MQGAWVQSLVKQWDPTWAAKEPVVTKGKKKKKWLERWQKEKQEHARGEKQSDSFYKDGGVYLEKYS